MAQLEERSAELGRYAVLTGGENMTYNSLCAGPQFPETPANPEPRDKRLQKLAKLSQQALVKYCDHILAHQGREVRRLSENT